MLQVEEKPAVASAARRRAVLVRSFALSGLFLLAVFYTLYFARAFFLPLTLALFLSFLLGPVVRALTKLHIPQALAAGLVLAAAVGILVFVIMKIARPVSDWMEEAPQQLRQVEDKVQRIIRPAAQLTQAAEKVQEMAGATGEQTQKVEVRTNHFAGSALHWTKEFITETVMVIILMFFLLASGNMFTLKLVKILPRLEDKKRAVDIARETESTISTYLFTITVINSCLGIAVGIVMYFIGLSNPLMWGALAAMLNFVPYFGPLLGVSILAVAGLVQFDAWAQGILPAACYLCLHGVEANLITPMILGKRLTLNPVVIFLSLMFWLWLWGVAGAFLAVPILMAIKIVCDRFERLAPISEFLGP